MPNKSQQEQHQPKNTSRMLLGALLAVMVLVPWVLLSAQEAVHRLQREVEVVQRTGPRATLTGRVREALASQWWLGPIRPRPAPDLLQECGIRLGSRQGLWEAVWRLRDNRRRLACLQERQRMARPSRSRLVLRLILWQGAFKIAMLVALAVCMVHASISNCIMSIAAAAGAHACVRKKQDSKGAGVREARRFSPLRVPVTPEVTFTLHLDDTAVPEWYQAHYHTLLNTFVWQEAQVVQEDFIAGRLRPQDMSNLLQDAADMFLSAPSVDEGLRRLVNVIRSRRCSS